MRIDYKKMAVLTALVVMMASIGAAYDWYLEPPVEYAVIAAAGFKGLK